MTIRVHSFAQFAPFYSTISKSNGSVVDFQNYPLIMKFMFFKAGNISALKSILKNLIIFLQKCQWWTLDHNSANNGKI